MRFNFPVMGAGDPVVAAVGQGLGHQLGEIGGRVVRSIVMKALKVVLAAVMASGLRIAASFYEVNTTTSLAMRFGPVVVLWLCGERMPALAALTGGFFPKTTLAVLGVALLIRNAVV